MNIALESIINKKWGTQTLIMIIITAAFILKLHNQIKILESKSRWNEFLGR